MTAKEKEYRHRVNLALDYIEKHYSEELTLDMIASVANFSKFHFHRVFYSIVGETLFDFIQRIRLEKAATRLKMNRDEPVADIAYDCGFSSPSTFARAFKELFNQSATEWRESSQSANSNISKAESKHGETNRNRWEMIDSTTSYFCDVNNSSIIEWSCKMFNKEDLKVIVKECEAIDIAYIRHIGPYKGNNELFGSLFDQICGWAGPRGLILPAKTKFMCVYYDSPDITDESKLRLDVCLSVAPDTKVEAPFGKSTIPSGKYAVCEFKVGPKDYEAAWGFLYGEWLPSSGFQPDDRPCYENYLSSPDESPDGSCRVEIYVPVKPL